MKVLLINECHSRMGGADIVYLNEGKLLEANGVEVMYYAPITSNMEKTKYTSYFYPGARNSFQKFCDSFYNTRAKRGLKKLLELEKPDIVHLHCFLGYESSSIYGVIKQYSIPIVHTVHDYRIVCPANHFLNKENKTCEQCKGGHFYKCLTNRCSKGNPLASAVLSCSMYFRNWLFNPLDNIDGFIFVSNFSRSKHLEHNPKFGQKKSIVLYNSTPISEPKSLTRNAYCLYFGRLSAEKGVDSLIDAFIKANNIQLKIVGTGPFFNTFQAIINNNGVHNIELLGYKTGEELYRLIREAKYVIVPSICYENNPMSVVEAFAFSKPVIGARSGAIPEFVIEGRTGYLFEKGNPEDIIRVVKIAYDVDDGTYNNMADNAFAFYNNNFSDNQHIKRLIGFYKEIISQNNDK